MSPLPVCLWCHRAIDARHWFDPASCRESALMLDKGDAK